MKCLKPMAGAVLLALAATLPGHAIAGPYADDMGKCLVKSTSPEDRAVLVKWIFSAMTLHPDLAPMASLSTAQRDALTRSAGALFQRLLLESCRTETQAAIQNEGKQTVEYAFQILGQVATRGLFNDPHVTEGLKDLGKSLDEAKMKALFTPAPDTEPVAKK